MAKKSQKPTLPGPPVPTPKQPMTKAAALQAEAIRMMGKKGRKK